LAIPTKNRDYWQKVWISFKAGDKDSFEEIYNEFTDMLFAYGSKITSDRELLKDCIQDLFIDLHRYNLELRHPEYLEYYLLKSLKHSLARKIQQSRQIQYLPLENTATFNLKFNLEEDYLLNETEQSRRESLKKIIQSLDAPKRELLFLKFNSGLNYAEIGEMLNLKPETVKKQIYRLLQSIRQCFSSKIAEFFVICFNR